MSSNNLQEFFRKYAFYIGIGALTLILIVIFRHKKFDIFEEGKKGIASLFTSDLKPLGYSSEISNEDVFNFAMFNSLPINKKENKLLFVNRDSTGQNSIDIRTANYKENTQNYDKFLEFLELNPLQRSRFDSLMSYYKSKIYSIILVNDQNTIAVNEKIPLLQQLINADILRMADKMNSEKLRQVYAGNREILDANALSKVDDFVSKGVEPQDYIIVNKDSAYTAKIKSEAPPVQQVRGVEAPLNASEKAQYWAEVDKLRNIEKNNELKSKYEFKRQNNNVRVFTPEVEITQGITKELEVLKKLPKVMSFFGHEENSKERRKGRPKFNVNFDLKGIDSLVAASMEIAYKFMSVEDQKKLKREMDSAINESKKEIQRSMQEINKDRKRMQRPSVNADSTREK